ncbi:hypothetical protein A2Z33_06825 [Candidatus Gottesmanbacteria bacterium RBG_16_52_11]|uniref:DUF1922 domain-containing protein n=1 Tax=Candidatus Gottesmanbacteria bacterium RBG_16_52_11 TaxID=1798374 RepID=A0A1F5YXW5_9BACT|nr:MAG: hypothetical protein A2Z33_06825 [Candidatus Gottesmanbacteria bacterium RBG_16_52_11]
MLKNIIAPVQAWLLAQGKCVGCGKVLEKRSGKGLVRVTCACGRIYMFDPAGTKYRRATFDEVR